MARTAITNIGPDPADKKLDEFLDGLSNLVANAVADGIKAGLQAQGVKVEGETATQEQRNSAFHRFKAPAAASASEKPWEKLGFKVPKAKD